jgi:chloramphenicol-sensitive protein RarD
MAMLNASMSSNPSRSSAIMVAGAYAWWGITPVYFRLLVEIDTYEIIAHRILWTLLCLALLKQLGLGAKVFAAHFRNPVLLVPFAVSSFCILLNWFVFTWAVTNGKVLDTSLGYFINPLISVLMGVILLGERLRPLQIVAVLLATAGVGQMVYRHGAVPWIALVLALSFALYGLLRKRAKVDAVNGLSLELIFGLPVALAYMGWQLQSRGDAMMNYDTATIALLFLAGPITMIPLLMFGSGAPRLNLTTVGILQYIAPTLSFGLAVFAYHEPFDQVKLTAFVAIWIGLAIYTADSVHASRRRFGISQAAAPLD